MARRGKKETDGVVIDHMKIIDGHGELADATHYQAREVKCGLCGKAFVFGPADQKYVHEVRGVPVKMADRGAAYCPTCLPVRSAQNLKHRRAQKLIDAHREASDAMKAAPDDVERILAAVQTGLAKQAVQPSTPSAEKLVGLARRAGRLAPERAAWRYWEGAALLATGRADAGKRSLTRFVEEVGTAPGLGALLRDARAKLGR